MAWMMAPLPIGLAGRFFNMHDQMQETIQQEDIKPRMNNLCTVKNTYKSNNTSCEKGPNLHCPSPVKDIFNHGAYDATHAMSALARISDIFLKAYKI
jgi:hypothetical protein